MRKYLFYADNNLSGTLNEEMRFNKIGIKVRKITKEEVTQINNILNRTIYLKKLYKYWDEYNDMHNKSHAECLKILNRLTNLPKLESIGYCYISTTKKEKGLIDKKTNTKLLKSLYIVEVDNTIKDVIDPKHVEVFLNKILNFTCFLSKEIYEITNYTNSVWFLEYDNLFDYSVNDITIFANIKLLLDINNHSIKCNFYKLYQLAELLNKKNKDYNFNYMVVIDSFINNGSLIENSIINGVSIIERILIDKDSDKKSNFILKVGSIIMNEERELVDAQILKKQLGAIYDIRSILLHGNDIKNIDKYTSIFSTKLDKTKSKFTIRRDLLISVDFYLTMYMKCVFNKFLSDFQFCEFLKEI